MKSLKLSVCLIFFSCPIFSQQPKRDSLLTVLKTTRIDTVKLNTYNALVSYYSTLDTDLADRYLDSMILLAKTNSNKKYEFKAAAQRGILFYRRGEIRKGIDQWLNSLNRKNINQYPIQKASLLNNVATGYKVLQKPDSVVHYMLEAIDINKIRGNEVGLIANYFNISNFYLNIKKNDEAINYLSKLQKIALKNNDEDAIAKSFVIMANISEREKDWSDALLQYKKAFEIFSRIQPENINLQQGLLYQHINVLSSSKNYRQALTLIEELKEKYSNDAQKSLFWTNLEIIKLTILIDIEDFKNGLPLYQKLVDFKSDESPKSGLLLSLALSRYEIETNRTTSKTLPRLYQTLEKCTTDENLDVEYHVLKNISKFKYNKGELNDAYRYLVQSNLLKDSLNNDEVLKLNLSLKRKFNEELKEKENLKLRTEKAEQANLLAQENKRKWQLGGGLIIAIIGLGIMAFIYRKNKKQKDAIQKQKNLVETLQKELHHRLKNNLSFIDLFINLAKSKFKDPAYQSKLTELQNRIKSMFEVHNQLFKKEDITSVKAKNYIDTLIQNVEKSFTNGNISIDNTTGSSETILANASFPVGLIVNEFVTNSYKYAFDDSQKGIINISLKVEGDNYNLQLKDNGKGLPAGFDIENLNSFGIETIQLLTKEYNGTFTIDGSQGVAMSIILPKTAA